MTDRLPHCTPLYLAIEAMVTNYMRANDLSIADVAEVLIDLAGDTIANSEDAERVRLGVEQFTERATAHPAPCSIKECASASARMCGTCSRPKCIRTAMHTHKFNGLDYCHSCAIIINEQTNQNCFGLDKPKETE